MNITGEWARTFGEIRGFLGGAGVSWFALYTAAALVVGAALFVFAEFNRRPDTPAPQRPGLCAIAGGFLWPVLVLGVAQLGLLSALRRRAVPPVDSPTRVVQHIG